MDTALRSLPARAALVKLQCSATYGLRSNEDRGRGVDGISAIAIFVGAGLGALLRWVLALALNPIFPALPLGTLAANALGSLLIGVAIGVFAQFEGLSLALRLAITTGFLGGLTTFSAFSAETTALLLRGQYGWAGATIAAHVGTCLLATCGGIAVVRWVGGIAVAG